MLFERLIKSSTEIYEFFLGKDRRSFKIAIKLEVAIFDE